VSGLAPIFVSLFCVALVLVGAAKFCAPPHLDEGTEAHIFHLLMVAQLPIALSFIFTRAGKPFVQILPVLALQVFAWAVAASAAALLT
jgi:hypothetical protein